MSTTKKILVTGGCGFIGSHTVVALIENGYTPVIVDNLANAEAFIHERLEQITGKKIRFYINDCTDHVAMDKIFGDEKFDGVIHFAAYKAVGESVAEPLKYYKNNIGSLVTMLELCEKHNIPDFVFSSSCTVYGTPKQIPVTENSASLAAESPYGNTKVIGERILQEYVQSGKKINAVLLRYFNPIGGHPSGLIGELPKGVPNNLIPYITQTAIGKMNALTVYGNDYSTADGTCIRDYIHVCDIADAHVAALIHIRENKNNPEIFNLGTGKGNTVLEVVQTFERVNKVKLNYVIGPRRSGDVESIFADNKKAYEQLKWKCKYTLADALEHAWNWEKQLANKA